MRKLLGNGTFFEGPRWHDGAWWASDMMQKKVWRIAPDGQADVVAVVDALPSGLGWLPDGDMLIVSMRDRRILRRKPDGTIGLYADLSAVTPFIINDMIVDAHGRAYVGDVGFDHEAGDHPRPTSIYRVDPDGTVAVAASDLFFPNGTVVADGGRTLVVGESFGNRMTAFTIGADGTLSDRRVWAQFGPTPKPAEIDYGTIYTMALACDGCDIDSDGCIWVADAANRRVCRVAEGRGIIDEIAGPNGEGVYACALGGADGRDLLICTTPSAPEEQSGEGKGSLYVTRLA